MKKLLFILLMLFLSIVGSVQKVSANTEEVVSGIQYIEYDGQGNVGIWSNLDINVRQRVGDAGNGKAFQVYTKATIQDGSVWYEVGTNQWIEGKYLTTTKAEKVSEVQYIQYSRGGNVGIWTNLDINTRQRVGDAGNGKAFQVYTKATLQDGSVWYEVGTNQWIEGKYLTTTKAEKVSGVQYIQYSGGGNVGIWSNLDINVRQRVGDAGNGKAFQVYTKATIQDGSVWYEVGTNQWIEGKYLTTTKAEKVSEVQYIQYSRGGNVGIWTNLDINTRQRVGDAGNGKAFQVYTKATLQDGSVWYEVGTNQWIEGKYLTTTKAEKVSGVQYIQYSGGGNVGIWSNLDINVRQRVGDAGNGKAFQVYTKATIQDGSVWYEVGTNQWIEGKYLTTSAPKKEKAQLVIAEAKKHLGKPYVWGTRGPNTFDCSGLMQYSFKQALGVNIGSYSVPQESSGTRFTDMSQLQAGDLVFWGSLGDTWHVALYIGNGQLIEAANPSQGVIQSVYRTPSFAVRPNAYK